MKRVCFTLATTIVNISVNAIDTNEEGLKASHSTGSLYSSGDESWDSFFDETDKKEETNTYFFLPFDHVPNIYELEILSSTLFEEPTQQAFYSLARLVFNQPSSQIKIQNDQTFWNSLIAELSNKDTQDQQGVLDSYISLLRGDGR